MWKSDPSMVPDVITKLGASRASRKQPFAAAGHISGMNMSILGTPRSLCNEQSQPAQHHDHRG